MELTCDDVIRALSSWEENHVSRKIVVPLLERMGMSDVQFVGGSNEAGVDVLFSCVLPPDDQVKYNGIQVKLGDLSIRHRNSRSIVPLVAQAIDGLTTLRLSVPAKSKIALHRYIILAVGAISDPAKTFISEKMERLSIGASRLVDFWDITLFTKLIREKYLREFCDAVGIPVPPTRNPPDVPRKQLELSPQPSPSDASVLNCCEKLVSMEIKSHVGRKYIHSLYIDRALQVEAAEFIEDRLVTNESIRRLFSTVSKGLSSLRRQFTFLPVKPRFVSRHNLTAVLRDIAGGTRHVLREHLDEAITEFDQWGKRIASLILSARQRRARLKRQSSGHLEQLERGRSRLQTLRGHIASMKRALQPGYVIVDRAGGGKTNLCCHLAEKYSRLYPTVLIYGKCDLSGAADLTDLINRRLQRHQNGTTMADLEAFARQSGTRVVIIIDAINECFDHQRLAQFISDFLRNSVDRPIKIVVTCRDLYWKIFEHDWAHDATYSIVRQQLYEFSADEWQQAVELYLDHFRILVSLGPPARDALHHPLMLRFFCETYGSKDAQVTYLGNVTDIRRRELFRLYCKRKFIEVARRTKCVDDYLVESMVVKIARKMREIGQRELLFDQIADDVGGIDARRVGSVYSGVLDEDIIIEERPTDNDNGITVSFVYDEFMEYLIAFDILRVWMIQKRERVASLWDQVHKLLNDRARFASTAGVAEYVVLAGLEDFKINVLDRLWNSSRDGQESVARILERLSTDNWDASCVELAKRLAMAAPRSSLERGVGLLIFSGSLLGSARDALSEVIMARRDAVGVILKRIVVDGEASQWRRDWLLNWLENVRDAAELNEVTMAALMVVPVQNELRYRRQLGARLKRLRNKLRKRIVDESEGVSDEEFSRQFDSLLTRIIDA